MEVKARGSHVCHSTVVYSFTVITHPRSNSLLDVLLNNSFIQSAPYWRLLVLHKAKSGHRRFDHCFKVFWAPSSLLIQIYSSVVKVFPGNDLRFGKNQGKKV